MNVATIDWIAVASICAVLSLALVVGKGVETTVRRWLGHRKDDAAEDGLLRTTVFGAAADDEHGIKFVPGLVQRMGAVETKVDVLIARTEANGGSSSYDLIVKLCEANGIPVPPMSASQRVPDDA